MDKALKGHPAEDLARLCFSKLRFLSVTLKDDLRRQGLWEDLVQELYRIALEGWRDGKTAREMGGVATRELRAFLRAYGYIRHRQDHVEGYIKPERTQSTFGTEDDHPDAVWERVLARATPVPTPYEAPRGLEEAILSLLREYPQGLSQCQVNRALSHQVSGVVVIDCCARLVVRGLVREVARTNGRGRPPSPLLILMGAGSGARYPATCTAARLMGEGKRPLSQRTPGQGSHAETPGGCSGSCRVASGT